MRIDNYDLFGQFSWQMTTLFRHFLVLGAMLGLLWQGVAHASPLCAEMQQTQNAAMAGMADCVDGDKQSNGKASPCKDMTAGCAAMVGCASLVALDAFFVSEGASIDGASSFFRAESPVLLGRSDPPIPDPPSILG